MSVKIVIDSTVDLIPEIKAKTTIVPLNIRFGEDEYQDGVNITAEKFYHMLVHSEQLPTTSQPTPAAFEQVYRELVDAGHEVLCITIASKLSGTYQSATIAAGEFPGKVFVFDTRTAAIASGVLAEYAIRLAEQGMGAEEILNELISKRSKVGLYAIVDTLEYLKKGGRLNAAAAVVGGILNLKPLICVEAGEIKILGTARGLKKAYAMLTGLCDANGVDPEKPILLGYTGESDDQLRAYIASCTELWGEEPNVSIVGATIGVHAGPGAVAVAYFKK